MKENITLIELDETVSTNTFLVTYQAAEPGTITVATAEFQSAGRGQTGNSWESEKGKNLLFSILVEPEAFPASHMFLLSEAIALSIREAIADALTSQPSALNRAASASSVTVKWPNDIYVDDRKIAGILIENTFSGKYVQRSIIGCGVNINQAHFLFPTLTPHPSSLSPHPSAPTPVSLHQLIGQDSDRSTLLNHILDAFLRRYTTLNPHPSSLTPHPSSLINAASASLHAEYRSVLYRRTGFHPFRDDQGEFLAEIVDVEPTGHLLLRDQSAHIRRYAFKEVSYIKK